MKTIEDLLASVKQMRMQYERGRIDRAILSKWILGLGTYPDPQGAALRAAVAWFRIPPVEPLEDLKQRDIACLDAIVTPTRE